MRNRFIVEERGEISLSADSETAVTCPALSQLLRSLARPTVDRITCHQLKVIDMLQIKYSSPVLGKSEWDGIFIRIQTAT